MPRTAAPLVLGCVLLVAAAASAIQTMALWPDGAPHSHTDPAQHAGLGFGMRQRSFLSLGQTVGEVDVRTDGDGTVWVVVALLAGGFALVDGTDPADPVLVKKVLTGGYGADVKMSDDTNTVYLSLQGGGGPCPLGISPVVPPWPQPLTCGVQVWDTLDKANPAFLATLPSSTSGSHMVDIEAFNGAQHMAMAAQGTPQHVPLAIVGADKVPVTVGKMLVGFNHDVTLRADPLTGAPTAFVANWDDGVRVHDLTVPALPRLLGEWDPPGGSGGHIHTVMPALFEGKRVVFAQQETFGQNVVSKLWALDATALDDIAVLGVWQNPDGKTTLTGSFRWSTHNFNVQDGKLYLAHYHGGVVVLDVSDPDLDTAPMLANFLPAGPSLGGEVPRTWDAFPHQGVVWATDINSGLYALELL